VGATAIPVGGFANGLGWAIGWVSLGCDRLSYIFPARIGGVERDRDMDQTALLAILEEAMRTQQESLDLTNQGIKELPDSIGNLHHLRSLSLCCNELTELPESIGNLIHLTALNLSGNKFTDLPDSICKLINLTALDLCYSQLTELPDSFGDLVNLTELDLTGNKLIALPDSFDNLIHIPPINLDGTPLCKSEWTGYWRATVIIEEAIQENSIALNLSYLRLKKCNYSGLKKVERFQRLKVNRVR
jgi:Leucine-rich repeat (LRR) protein